ncbi:MAG: cell division protein SepF [Firmicutes bacterium]|nr:cell division protein SepF [Bacillota bacterium]MDY6160282.1 cell division protein SepF [Candidatus Faecousia sp.]
MSFWDNVKKFTQPYADDDYDDYDEEEEESADQYDEPEERPARRPSRRTTAPAPAPAPAEEPSEEDDFGFGAAPLMSSPSSNLSGSGFSGQVLNMNSSASVSNKQEVVLFRPNTFNDTSKAADDLRSRKAVIVNMENVDKAMARRVVDFLSGCVYALDGDVKKIAQSAYLFCPHNMDIVGDLETLQAEVESYI